MDLSAPPAPAAAAKTPAATSATKPASVVKPTTAAKATPVKTPAAKPSTSVTPVAKEISKDQKSALIKLAKEHPECGLDDSDSLLNTC